MLISLILVGKTSSKNIETEINDYVNRIKNYTNFTVELIPAKNAKAQAYQKKTESEEILKKIKPEDYVILLDERGKELTSVGFSEYIQNLQNQSRKKVIFVIGGAFGVTKEIFQRADFTMALSMMTFSHQMVRLFFVEQLYRSYTIINNQSYHL